MTNQMGSYKSYKVGRDGTILGVFDEPELVYMISSGKVLGTDDFWTDGMGTWAKISSREVWTISSRATAVSSDSSSNSTSASLPPPLAPASTVGSSNSSQTEWEIRREALVELEMNRRRQLRENSSARAGAKPSVKVPEVSFFSIWWKTVLVIYVAGVCLGYLNSGEYGLGYALGGGLLVAPMSGLLFGGIIYAFSRK